MRGRTLQASLLPPFDGYMHGTMLRTVDKGDVVLNGEGAVGYNNDGEIKFAKFGAHEMRPISL